MTYVDLMARQIHLPVVSTDARFIRPVAYDETLDVTTSLSEVTGVRLIFEYELRREGERNALTRARTEHAAVDANGRPKRFPEDILRLLK